MKELSKHIYVGLVEENIDPKRLGRLKIRVQGVFNEIPLEDIPWAHSYSGVAGKDFQVPAKGKIVNVIFQGGNLYYPLWIYSENYNINLSDKLKSLSDEDYINFISILFDHQTQIYSSNQNLTIDYLFNKITIDKSSVNIELKNDTQKLNLGSVKADQQALLSNHFFDWMDKFIDKLAIPTTMIDHISAPIVRPELDKLCAEYKQKRKTFVSNNVYIIDNDKVTDMNENNREMGTKVIINDKDLKINNENAITYKDPAVIIDKAKTGWQEKIKEETVAEKEKVDESKEPQKGNDQQALVPTIKILDDKGEVLYSIQKDSEITINDKTVIIISGGKTIKLEYDVAEDAISAKNQLVSKGLIDKSAPAVTSPTTTGTTTSTDTTGATTATSTPVNNTDELSNTEFTGYFDVSVATDCTKESKDGPVSCRNYTKLKYKYELLQNGKAELNIIDGSEKQIVTYYGNEKKTYYEGEKSTTKGSKLLLEEAKKASTQKTIDEFDETKDAKTIQIPPEQKVIYYSYIASKIGKKDIEIIVYRNEGTNVSNNVETQIYRKTYEKWEKTYNSFTELLTFVKSELKPTYPDVDSKTWKMYGKYA